MKKGHLYSFAHLQVYTLRSRHGSPPVPKMSPTIRIDDEVFAELQRHARPLVDTPNSVLRKRLGLDPAAPQPDQDGDGGGGGSGPAQPASDHADSTKGALILQLDGPGYSARGREGQDCFFVLEGSYARKNAVRSIPDRTTKKRRELLDHDVLVEDSTGYRFVKNCSFGSPSAAACVVVGGSEDGLRAWKDHGGRPLKEIRRAGR